MTRDEVKNRICEIILKGTDWLTKDDFNENFEMGMNGLCFRDDDCVLLTMDLEDEYDIEIEPYFVESDTFGDVINKVYEQICLKTYRNDPRWVRENDL